MSICDLSRGDSAFRRHLRSHRELFPELVLHEVAQEHRGAPLRHVQWLDAEATDVDWQEDLLATAS